MSKQITKTRAWLGRGLNGILVLFCAVVFVCITAATFTVDLSSTVQDTDTNDVSGTDVTLSAPQFIRWDTDNGGAIPSNAASVRMTVHLRVSNTKNMVNNPVWASRLLRPWVDAQVLAADYSDGNAWAQTNADSAISPFYQSAASVSADSIANSTTADRVNYQWVAQPPVKDVNWAVDDWIIFDMSYYATQVLSGRWDDNGIFLSNLDLTGPVIYSSENTTAANRPIVMLSYILPDAVVWSHQGMQGLGQQ